MTEPASPATSIDAKHLRDVLCGVRRMQGGGEMLFAVWFGLEAARAYLDGTRTTLYAWGLGAVGGVVYAVATTIAANRLDDAMAAGPPEELLVHARSTLDAVAGPDVFVRNRVVVALRVLVAAGLVSFAAWRVFGEEPPDRLAGAAHLAFAGAIALRPLWNLWRRIPAFARELEALPPIPPPSADLVARTVQLLASGKKIEAIRRWRAATGQPLPEAKAAVEGLQRGPV
jgi:hypothetical protein